MSETQLQPSAANYQSTPIIDFDSVHVQAVVARLTASSSNADNPLAAAHSSISGTMEAVYSIDDLQPASKTFATNRGSCVQRMICLEALARGMKIATRVRALWLDRSFWYSRLPLIRSRLPAKTLMPWPQFYKDGRWIDFDEIYAPIVELAKHPAYQHAFTNAGESLFDAVQHTPVDLLGKLRKTQYEQFDIGHFVAEDGGFYATRDDLYKAVGEQTSWLGKLVFNTLYGGRPIHRKPD